LSAEEQERIRKRQERFGVVAATNASLLCFFIQLQCLAIRSFITCIDPSTYHAYYSFMLYLLAYFCVCVFV
jgi:hypothetical protein